MPDLESCCKGPCKLKADHTQREITQTMSKNNNFVRTTVVENARLMPNYATCKVKCNFKTKPYLTAISPFGLTFTKKLKLQNRLNLIDLLLNTKQQTIFPKIANEHDLAGGVYCAPAGSGKCRNANI